MNVGAEFMWGAAAACSAIVALFFMRYWRDTRDRFFALFGLAFALLATNWTVLALMRPDDESRAWVYLIRLAAFLIIVGAIVDKNRGPAAVDVVRHRK